VAMAAMDLAPRPATRSCGLPGNSASTAPTCSPKSPTPPHAIPAWLDTTPAHRAMTRTGARPRRSPVQPSWPATASRGPRSPPRPAQNCPALPQRPQAANGSIGSSASPRHPRSAPQSAGRLVRPQPGPRLVDEQPSTRHA
jgi:hypothetical protein